MDETPQLGFSSLNWECLASELRIKVLELSHQAKAAHLASALSCIDILTVLYESVLKLDPQRPAWTDRDRFVLSKGHAAAALYVVLAYKGFIDSAHLATYGQVGSLLEEHPSPKQPGVEAATGSLGHGLPTANGMVLGARIRRLTYRVFVLLSDGECNEGSVWEAAMFAARHELNRLCAIVDFNKWQATGRSQDVLALDPLADKWRSFGWDVEEIDGHDHQALFDAFSKEPNGSPRVFIAHTVKGKGVSFMEDDNNWHYRVPTREEIDAARVELGLR